MALVPVYSMTSFVNDAGLTLPMWRNWFKKNGDYTDHVLELQKEHEWPDVLLEYASLRGILPVPGPLMEAFGAFHMELKAWNSELVAKIRSALENKTKYKDWEPDTKDASGNICEKRCQKCNELKDINLFAMEKTKRREICNTCRNKTQDDRHKQKDITETRKCEICEEVLSITSFEANRKKCKTCRSQVKESKNKTDPEKTKDKVIEKGKIPHECKICTVSYDKDKDNFTFIAGKAIFRNICKECHNDINKARGYKAKQWLAGKSEEGEEAFLMRMAEKCKDYRDKNPDKRRQYVLNRACNVIAKLKDIRLQAEKRGFRFEEYDWESFADKLTSPCSYCGRVPSDQNPKLNGLDRVDNNIGYTDFNTVASCTTCNFMKGTQSQLDFIYKAKLIAQENPRDIQDFVMYIEPGSFGNTNTKNVINSVVQAEIGWRSKAHSFEHIENSNTCYICHTQGANSIDRVDPSLNVGCPMFGYTPNNTQVICKVCNYMKKDMKLETFLIVCNKISSYLKVIDECGIKESVELSTNAKLQSKTMEKKERKSPIRHIRAICLLLYKNNKLIKKYRTIKDAAPDFPVSERSYAGSWAIDMESLSQFSSTENYCLVKTKLSDSEFNVLSVSSDSIQWNDVIASLKMSAKKSNQQGSSQAVEMVDEVSKRSFASINEASQVLIVDRKRLQRAIDNGWEVKEYPGKRFRYM